MSFLYLTVTTQVAVLLPSVVLTVIVAVPLATAVTLPFASTVATVLFDDVHVTFLLVAVVGLIVAVNGEDCLAVSDSVDLFSVTLVTGVVTVTETVADLLPSFVLTVIDAVPTATAVTLPFTSTVATFVFDEV